MENKWLNEDPTKKNPLAAGDQKGGHSEIMAQVTHTDGSCRVVYRIQICLPQ